MEKKEKIKFIFKWIGIGCGIAVGFVGLVCAYLGISGGFRKKVIEPTQISFSKTVENFYGEDEGGVPVYVINEDDFFVINPLPEDSTELDATVKIASGSQLVSDILVKGESVDEQGEAEYVPAEKIETKLYTYKIRLGEPFKIVLDENQSLVEKRTIELEGERETNSCKAKIFVDTKLESYELKYEKINAESGSENNFFPGDKLYVYVDMNTIMPKTALKQSTLTELTNQFKAMEFECLNTDVAVIEKIEIGENKMPKALVNILKDGQFTIQTHIANTYENQTKLKIQDEVDLMTEEDQKAYKTMVYGGVDENEQEVIGFMKKSEISIISHSIEVERIYIRPELKNPENILKLKLFNESAYYLYPGEPTQSSNPLAQYLGLKINPKYIAGSHYTSADLNYLLEDVEIYGAYFVNTEEQADQAIMDDEGNNKYLKITDRYLEIKKEYDQDKNQYWIINVNDYFSNIEPSNCMVLSLRYSVMKYDENNQLIVNEETGEVETEEKQIFNFIPVTITKPDIPNIMVKVDNSYSKEIEITYDDKLEQNEEQSQIEYDLSNARMILVDDLDNPIIPEKTLEQSDSPYKKVLYVVKNGVDYDFENEYISIDNETLKITPKKIGTTYFYAIVMKTDRNGNIVDSENNAIEDPANYLIQGLPMFESPFITVSILEELVIENTEDAGIISLYKKNGTNYQIIEENDEDFELEINSSNKEITEVSLYDNSSVYVKINANNQQTLFSAYTNGRLTFELEKQSLALEENVILGSMIGIKEDGNDLYLLQISAINVNKQNNFTRLIIKLDDVQIYSLNMVVLGYVLQEINIESNDTQSQVDTANIKLKFNNNTEQGFEWLIDDTKELELEINLNPSKAIIIGELDYKIYELKDGNFDPTTVDPSIINQEFISNNFDLSDKILTIKSGYPMQNSEEHDTLKFDIKKAGTVVLIASYVRDDDVKIYSKPFKITVRYTNSIKTEINYGNNAEVDENNQKYQTIITTFEEQKTDLLTFTLNEDGYEKSTKIAIQHANNSEATHNPINVNLYKFEIEINNDLTLDKTLLITDFKVEIGQNNGGINTVYLITPKVQKAVYIKIKISTTFGYDPIVSYGYKLLPDINSQMPENNTISLVKDEDKPLFKLKLENGKIVNDGGEIFITNLENTNYVYTEEATNNNITGQAGDKIQVVYLPYDYDVTDIASALINEGFVLENGVYSKTDEVSGNTYHIEFRLNLHISVQNDPNTKIKTENGVLSTDLATKENYNVLIYELENDNATIMGEFTLSVN